MSSLAVRDDWDSHWDDYASSAERNPAQRYRRKLILSSLGLDQAASTPRVLDIGSGQGDFAVEVLAACPGAQILGLELSTSGVQIAARKVPEAQFLQCDLLQPHEPPPSRQAWASHAVCSEVLEHLDDPQRLLANAQAWMAPACTLIVTVPGGPMSAFDQHIGHRRHYRPEDLRCLLERAGFRVDLASGAGYPFFDLYRRVVIARGSRLIGDVSRKPSLAARTAMGVFDALFRLNVRSRGWQTFAIATYPA
jgi:trans-aconitate methyltransferase